MAIKGWTQMFYILVRLERIERKTNKKIIYDIYHPVQKSLKAS
jgi:hypothetical protein